MKYGIFYANLVAPDRASSFAYRGDRTDDVSSPATVVDPVRITAGRPTRVRPRSQES